MISLRSIADVLVYSGGSFDKKTAVNEVENGIVTRLSCGNVSMQNGHYVTKESLDKMAEKVISHNY